MILIYWLRRYRYPAIYRAAIRDYWAAETMTECRSAWRRLCWFGEHGGFGLSQRYPPIKPALDKIAGQ